MKKLLKLVLAALLVFSLAACSSNSGNDEPADTAKKVKVAVLLPFTGDQSYFDTLAAGVKKVNAENSDKIEVVLMEVDPNGSADKATWENAYAEVCEDGEYDLVVSGNSTYEGFLADACAKYPNQKFMNFDTSWAIECPSNCYAVKYGLDDLGYVVGYLSAKLTKTNKVGVVVGMDFQSMNQFISGYCQVLAAEDVQYAVVYPNSFTDAALGKEYTENLIKQGCDVIWQVAGGLGNGVIEACSNNPDVWCVGVDGDQYATFESTNPAWANTIITSALKSTDLALEAVCKMVIDGTIDSKMGVSENLSFDTGAVGIADNAFYQANVSEEIRNDVADVMAKISSGEIQVIDALDMADYANEWPALRDANIIK